MYNVVLPRIKNKLEKKFNLIKEANWTYKKKEITSFFPEEIPSVKRKLELSYWVI